MGYSIRLRSALVAAALAMLAVTSPAQVNVTTYHNDNARTGQNVAETTLTHDNVNSTQFGKLYSVTVDGAVYAQPLYLSEVEMPGGSHNVLYVATEHDSLFAIDADTGAQLWKKSLLAAGAMPVVGTTDLYCSDVGGELGVTGTPVIDAATGTLYVVAKSKLNGVVSQHLHAIDVKTGAEKFGGPTQIKAQVPGSASDGNGTTVTFDARWQFNRPALLLENGHVIIGWGAHCDKLPWHGWIMSYNASTLAQEAVLNTSPNGYGSGIWMSGGGLAADAAGNIYAATGNGSWNGTTDFGDSIIKLGPPANDGFPIRDYFTPFNQNILATRDFDLSAGSVTLLPKTEAGKQYLTIIGKDGRMFLLDQGNLGKYCLTQTPACTNSNPQIVQEVPNTFTGMWDVSAFWNGNIYWSGGNGSSAGGSEPIKAFSFDDNGSGLLSTKPTSITAKAFAYTGPTPSISANGESNAILWGMDNSQYTAAACTDGSNCQVLYAYDATNLSNLLYTSNDAPNNRDVPAGGAIKWTTPTIANGKVFVPSKGAVSAYGLLASDLPTAGAPSFTPTPGAYTTKQYVRIASTTPGATIYYTRDGVSTPTTASLKYIDAIQLTATTTIKAIAVANGYKNSAVNTVTYAFDAATPTAAAPTFTPTPGSYTGRQYVRIATTTPGATIYYTRDGVSTPSTASLKYIDAIQLTATTTIKAIAVANGYKNSAVTTVTYAFDAATPTAAAPMFTPTPGSYTGRQYVRIATTMPGATIYYTRDGVSTPTTASIRYIDAIQLTASTTIKAFVVAPGYQSSGITTATYTFSPATAAPTFTPSPGNYTAKQYVRIASATPGATIYYTRDGKTTPTAASIKYIDAIQLTATTTIKAIAVTPDHPDSGVTTATFSFPTP